MLRSFALVTSPPSQRVAPGLIAWVTIFLCQALATGLVFPSGADFFSFAEELPLSNVVSVEQLSESIPPAPGDLSAVSRIQGFVLSVKPEGEHPERAQSPVRAPFLVVVDLAGRLEEIGKEVYAEQVKMFGPLKVTLHDFQYTEYTSGRNVVISCYSGSMTEPMVYAGGAWKPTSSETLGPKLQIDVGGKSIRHSFPIVQVSPTEPKIEPTPPCFLIESCGLVSRIALDPPHFGPIAEPNTAIRREVREDPKSGALFYLLYVQNDNVLIRNVWKILPDLNFRVSEYWNHVRGLPLDSRGFSHWRVSVREPYAIDPGGFPLPARLIDVVGKGEPRLEFADMIRVEELIESAPLPANRKWLAIYDELLSKEQARQLDIFAKLNPGLGREDLDRLAYPPKVVDTRFGNPVEYSWKVPPPRDEEIQLAAQTGRKHLDHLAQGLPKRRTGEPGGSTIATPPAQRWSSGLEYLIAAFGALLLLLAWGIKAMSRNKP